MELDLQKKRNGQKKEIVMVLFSSLFVNVCTILNRLSVNLFILFNA